MEFFLSQMIPLFGIFMIIAVVIGPIWINAYFKARERAQLHETLRIAYEKGQPPPPELVEKLTADAPSAGMGAGGRDADLRRAVVLIAVGLGLAGLGFCLGLGITQASDVGGWIEPVYFRGSKDTTGTAAYDFDGYGLSLGLEKKVGAGRVGVTFNWLSGKIHDGDWDDISATSLQLGAFWRMSAGPFYAYARVGANKLKFDSTRTFTGEVDLATLTYTAYGSWSGWAVSGSGGASYKFDLGGNFNLKPMVIVDYLRMKENGYDETGDSAIILDVNGRTSDSLAATTTVTAGWSLGEVTPDERPVTFEVEGGRRNQLAGTLGSTTAAFQGGSQFTITPDSLSSGWLGEARMLFGGMDYTWEFSTRADKLYGKADLSARLSLSLAM